MVRDWIWNHLVEDGGIVVIDAAGRVHQAPGHETAPVVVRTSDPLFPGGWLRDPTLAVGETYMDGRLVLKRGTL